MEAGIAAPPHSPWGWAFLAVIAGAVLLMGAGIALAAVRAHSQQAAYRPASPEGRVQRYFNLLQSGKTDQAYDMTAIADYGSGFMTRWEFHQQFDSWSQSSHQVTLESTTVAGGHASVTVDISSFSGGPFGASAGSNRVTITLDKTQKGWIITGPPYLPGS